MTIRELIQEFEKKIPIQQAEDFDNVGLLCGNPNREVSGVLVSHDVLENVVEEAIEKNANLIVCFHPIIFTGLKSITGKNYVERTVVKAIENKIAIYAIHTAFDNDFYGVNEGICKVLGLVNREILMPKKNSLKQLVVYVPRENAENLKLALFEAGAGNIGYYEECSFNIHGTGNFKPKEGAEPVIGSIGIRESVEETMISVVFEDFKQHKIIAAMKFAHPYEEVAYQVYSLENENHFVGLGMIGELEEAVSEQEFLHLVKDKFHLELIKHSQFLNKKIKKIAVLGGSGSSGIKAAIARQCDAYITADLKYHDYFLAESTILLCDIGHFESEQFVVQQIFEILSQKFSTFAISKSSEKTNPVNYFI